MLEFTKWLTNDKALQERIDVLEGKQCEHETVTHVKVLGVTWNQHTDNFIVDINELYESSRDISQQK